MPPTVSRTCAYCAKRFNARLDRRLFCCDACRVRYNREHKLRCFYCGTLSDTREHITPQAVKRNGNYETVNACRECNTTLGAYEPLWLEGRVAELTHRTVKKYQLDKPIPEWHDDELDELGPSLRQAVGAKIRARQIAAERVLHMQGVLRLLLREVGKENADQNEAKDDSTDA